MLSELLIRQKHMVEHSKYFVHSLHVFDSIVSFSKHKENPTEYIEMLLLRFIWLKFFSLVWIVKSIFSLSFSHKKVHFRSCPCGILFDFYPLVSVLKKVYPFRLSAYFSGFVQIIFRFVFILLDPNFLRRRFNLINILVSEHFVCFSTWIHSFRPFFFRIWY